MTAVEPPAVPVEEPPGLADVVAATPVRAVTNRPDSVEFNANGKVTMVIAKEKYELRCPSIDEMEPFRESLRVMTKKQTDRAAVGDVTYDPVYDIRDWVIDCVNAFCDHPYAVPDNATPPWLTNGALPGRVIAHWRTIPESD